MPPLRSLRYPSCKQCQTINNNNMRQMNNCRGIAAFYAPFLTKWEMFPSRFLPTCSLMSSGFWLSSTLCWQHGVLHQLVPRLYLNDDRQLAYKHYLSVFLYQLHGRAPCIEAKFPMMRNPSKSFRATRANKK